MADLLHLKASNLICLDDHRSRLWDSDSLAVVKSDLADVDRVTERSFLELAGKIELFHRRAYGISSVAGDVLQLLNGENGENTLQHLQLLVERCSLWLSSTGDQSTEICTLLKNVSLQITSLYDPIAGLRKVTKTLHALRVSTRIEAAKGYATGASVLAKSLDELAFLIHAKTADIFDRTQALIPKIDEILVREEASLSGQIKVANREVQQARRLINAFVANNIETGVWTDRLKDQSDDVTNSFSEMIAALQFQDITRQRVEHVQDALESLGRHLEKFNQRSDCSHDEAAYRLFGRICRLQHGQLSLACHEFLVAADNLTAGLHSLSASVVSMAGDTRELSRAADVGSDTHFGSVLNVLKTIAGYLDSTLDSHQSAGRHLALACQEIQVVSALVEEVELIGEELQLLAMNAAIGAAHARQQGAGLDIVARNVHVVAEEATAYAHLLARECGTIASHASHLQEIESKAQASAEDVGHLLEEARTRTDTIETSFKKLQGLAAEVDGAAASLATDVDIAANSIDIRVRFQEKILPALDLLDELSLTVDEKVTAADSVNLETLFGELEYCYTMDSERQIHKHFIAEQDHAPADTETEKDEWSNKRHHDLGDNVDLF